MARAPIRNRAVCSQLVLANRYLSIATERAEIPMKAIAETRTISPGVPISINPGLYIMTKGTIKQTMPNRIAWNPIRKGCAPAMVAATNGAEQKGKVKKIRLVALLYPCSVRICRRLPPILRNCRENSAPRSNNPLFEPGTTGRMFQRSPSISRSFSGLLFYLFPFNHMI